MEVCVECKSSRKLTALGLSTLHQNVGQQSIMSSGRPSKVRRCLFGPSDQEQSRRDALTDEKFKEAEQMKKKWNFDFEKDIPLRGRYKWEKVCPSEENTGAASVEGKRQNYQVEKDCGLKTPEKTT